MKRSLGADIAIVIGVVILNEILHATLYDVYSPPRSQGDKVSFGGDLILTLLITVLLYQRYKPLKQSILYGVLIGLLLLIPIHLNQYPTASNLAILMYKLGVGAILAVVFNKVLIGKGDKKIIKQVIGWDFATIRKQEYTKVFPLAHPKLIASIKENDTLRLPHYIENGADLKIKKIFNSPDNDNRAFFLTDNDRLSYLVFASVEKEKMAIKHFSDHPKSRRQVEQQLERFFNQGE